MRYVVRYSPVSSVFLSCVCVCTKTKFIGHSSLTHLLFGPRFYLCKLPLGVLPQTRSVNTALKALVPVEDMTADQLKIKDMVDKWRVVRLMDRAHAEAELDEEWMTAYNKYHENYNKHMELMKEIKEKVAVMIEPPKIEKKGKKQRKRDIFAKKQARDAAIARKSA
jgi:hypothetical protein